MSNSKRRFIYRAFLAYFSPQEQDGWLQLQFNSMKFVIAFKKGE